MRIDLKTRNTVIYFAEVETLSDRSIAVVLTVGSVRIS